MFYVKNNYDKILLYNETSVVIQIRNMCNIITAYYIKMKEVKELASWLTHLRIAEKIKNTIKDIDLNYLLIGSIAPDFILYDDSYKTSLLANITDIKLDIDINVLNYAIADFYNKYMHPQKLIVRSDKTRSFLWGCYFHLITNKAWIEEYYSQFTTAYEQHSEDIKQDMSAFIKEEMFALDFKYLESNGTNIINEFRNYNFSLNYFCEFDTTYINEYKSKIIDFYSKEAASTSGNLEFFSLNSLESFICKISNKCIRTLLY